MPPKGKQVVASREAPEPESESEIENSEEDEVYDSEIDEDGESEGSDDESDVQDTDSDGSDDGFEQQSSSDEESSDGELSKNEDGRNDEAVRNAESITLRNWNAGTGRARTKAIAAATKSGELATEKLMHYDDLSSDDDEVADNGNTVGRVPLHWYDAFDHIGYNIAGSKIVKRKGMDRIDTAIAMRDDPSAAKTIYDMYNDRQVVLTDRELEIIRRMQAGAFAHPEYDDTPDYVDYESSIKETMPLSAAPEPKRRFLPSKWEMMKVMKIVQAIKEGRYKEGEKSVDKPDEKAPVYLIWNEEEDDILAESKRYQFHLPAPKMPLPGHAESYNPPAEYLLTDEEQKQQAELDPKDREYSFTPKAHSCLRHVAGYENFVRERFERCLDLYLCPRKLKRRLNIDPETLVPRLPSPKELKPFPNTLTLQFLGHQGAVRCIAISPDGQYLASGGEDGTVRLWELDTCYCRYVWDLAAVCGPPKKAGAEEEEDGSINRRAVVQVVWNPDSTHGMLIAVVHKSVVVIATGTCDADSAEITEVQLQQIEQLAQQSSSGDKEEEGDDNTSDSEDSESEADKKKKKSVCKWVLYNGQEKSKKGKSKTTAPASSITTRHGAVVGPRVRLVVESSPVTNVAWHHKGDYLAVLAPQAGAQAVSIHQISKGKTQYPFSKSSGIVQAVSFHPVRPYIFVVTQQHVKIFHLIEQKLVKKLVSGCKWLSSVDIHPSGDHVLLGSYDRRVVWFDLDLASTPYKTLKFHEKAVRSVQYHRRYPLMASASDDGNVHIFHCMVYSDLTRNPLLVPLKVLRGHGVVGGHGVFDIAFHPKQPWIASCGADGVINLYQDI